MNEMKMELDDIRSFGIIGWGGDALRKAWRNAQRRKRIRYVVSQAVDWIKRGIRW